MNQDILAFFSQNIVKKNEYPRKNEYTRKLLYGWRTRIQMMNPTLIQTVQKINLEILESSSSEMDECSDSSIA